MCPENQKVMDFEKEFAIWLKELLEGWGFSGDGLVWANMGFLLLLTLIICFIIYVVSKRFLLSLIKRFTARTKTDIDDVLVEKKVFDSLAVIAPALFFELSVPTIFEDFPDLIGWIVKGVQVYMMVIVIHSLNRFLNAVSQVLSTTKNMRDKPVDSYVQLGKILNFLVGVIIIFSITFEKSPLYLLSALGAMTAVLLLIFKDTILGFVASIQLATNDIVRLGDWVSMERYGADGDVMEFNLTTIKVRNFDKTITTIPTYAFVSDSFKNWRGMMESDGRRIKRSVNINLQSIRFLDEEMIEKLKTIELAKNHLDERFKEIAEHNEKQGVDKSRMMNGRNLTNLGVFRAYLENYLANHPGINTDMTLMVRQLQPGDNGVPLEVYAFTRTKVWADYEEIMADIFDHILASAPDFWLEIFQAPSGPDFQSLRQASN